MNYKNIVDFHIHTDNSDDGFDPGYAHVRARRQCGAARRRHNRPLRMQPLPCRNISL